MKVTIEMSFDVPFDEPEEQAYLQKQIELAGKDAIISKFTKDVYSVFQDELIDAENVEINISINE